MTIFSTTPTLDIFFTVIIKALVHNQLTTRGLFFHNQVHAHGFAQRNGRLHSGKNRFVVQLRNNQLSTQQRQLRKTIVFQRHQRIIGQKQKSEKWSEKMLFLKRKRNVVLHWIIMGRITLIRNFTLEINYWKKKKSPIWNTFESSHFQFVKQWLSTNSKSFQCNTRGLQTRHIFSHIETKKFSQIIGFQRQFWVWIVTSRRFQFF